MESDVRIVESETKSFSSDGNFGFGKSVFSVVIDDVFFKHCERLSTNAHALVFTLLGLSVLYVNKPYAS